MGGEVGETGVADKDDSHSIPVHSSPPSTNRPSLCSTAKPAVLTWQ